MGKYRVTFLVLQPVPHSYVVDAESEIDAKAEAVKKLVKDSFVMNPELIQDYRVVSLGQERGMLPPG